MSAKPGNALSIRQAQPREAQQLTDLTSRSKAVWGYSAEHFEILRE
jgi:hypothetical protein